jgi:hypothetical protein
VTHFDEAKRRVRPRAAQDPAFMAVLEVLCAQLQSLDELLVQLGLLYSLGHPRAPLSILDKIGALLSLPRQAGWTRAQYLTLLRVRLRGRTSFGTYDDVKQIANLLRRPGTVTEASVSILHPEGLQIAIPVPGAGVKFTRSFLLGAIQETTSLDLVAVSDASPGEFLILSDPEHGLDSKLAEPL